MVGGHQTSGENGFGPKPSDKETTNGHAAPPSHHASAAFSNGSSALTGRMPYVGQRKEEVTRIVIQALNDLGYNDAASSVMRQSGYALENEAVALFRAAILAADWESAINLLGQATPQTQSGPSSSATQAQNLVLVPGADVDSMIFAIFRQKYLEYLEQSDTAKALIVLRGELTPLALDKDSRQLHTLSSFLMCQGRDDLFAAAKWDGASGASRHNLLTSLTEFISPSIMLPEHRLSVLLDQVNYYQNAGCLYHTDPDKSSLYTDHRCDIADFPSQLLCERATGSDETWEIQFSNDGKRLASCGPGSHVLVWDVETFKIVLKLDGHTAGAGSVVWSPDDSMLLSCGRDGHIRVFDTQTGLLRSRMDKFDEPICRCFWVPTTPENGFGPEHYPYAMIVGSLDKNRPLCLVSPDGDVVHSFTDKHRTEDVALSSNGQWLVATDNLEGIHVYEFANRRPAFRLQVSARPVSIEISKEDPDMLLVYRQDGEVHLLDLAARGRFVRRYMGSVGGAYVIRAAFGGANESFVAAGSEDGSLIIWHKNIGSPLIKIEAHKPRCNSVRWSPTDPRLFASCGDDGKIKIWSTAKRVREFEELNESANSTDGFIV